MQSIVATNLIDERFRGSMTRKHFGTDGIRGTANGVITPDLAMKVAQATGLLFQRGEYRHRVVIGKDTRLSGYMIEAAMQAGFTSVGMDVLLLGPMPTPAVAMLTRSMRADVGIMISASHNPYEDNGIKLFGPDGYKLSDEIELKIEALMDRPQLKLAKSGDLGRAKRVDDVRARYIEFAKHTLPRNLSLDGLRIVVDCANGAAYKVAPEALWELGAEVFAIGVDPDGFNINRGVGSTAPEALVKKVREMRADIGIALDGDADRVLIVDEMGRIVDGDQLMGAVAQYWQEGGKLSQPGIVATLMSNLGLERFLDSIGLSLARTAVGDRYVLEFMRQHGYNLGGEQSGHIILSDYVTTGDGLVAALQVMALVKSRGRPVSEVCHCFEPVPQVLKNVRFELGRRPPGREDRQRRRRRAPAARQCRASGHPPVGHRAGRPRHGRGRRFRSRRIGRRRYLRRVARCLRLSLVQNETTRGIDAPCVYADTAF